MPRVRRHPFTRAVRRALPGPLTLDARRFLELLDRRLAALARGRDPRTSRDGRARARRFLARRREAWDDGDEALVRSHLDRWLSASEQPARAGRSGLLRAARELARIRARPATLWFFLWEMESILSAGRERRGGRRTG